jgi:hypothetical protein
MCEDWNDANKGMVTTTRTVLRPNGQTDTVQIQTTNPNGRNMGGCHAQLTHAVHYGTSTTYR